MGFLDGAGAGPFVMAHRGLSASVTGGVHDENSLAAFARAVALGCRYLETDVRTTSDGVALAFHDSVLDRVTDARGIIARRPFARVGLARIGGVEPVPTLAQVLAAFPDACVNIDVKSDDGVEPTARAVTAAGAQDRVCLAAFSDRRLARLRRRLPGVTTALGPAEVAAVRARSVSGAVGRAYAPRRTGRCVQVPERVGLLRVVDRAFVVTAHRLGLPVHVWTVNDPARMRRLLALGVDGLITDRADLAAGVVAELRRAA